jgi:hypothetical protein
MEKNPSREEIERKFGISQPTQIGIEKRLGVRKDFRNIGKTQTANTYLVNRYLMENIFKVLNHRESEKRLEKTVELNKKALRKNKIYNKNGQPKLTNNQLNQLTQLHNQLTK